MSGDRRAEPRGGHAVGAAALITVSTYITYAVGLLSGAIVARALGPTDYGRYAFFVWLTGWLVTVGNHGIPTSAIRFVSQALGQQLPLVARATHDLLSRWQQWSLLIVGSGFVVIAFATSPTDWSDAPLLFIAATVVSMLFRAFYLFDISVAKGNGRFEVEAWSTLSASALTIAATALLASLQAPVHWFVALFALSSCSMFCLSRLLLRRAGIRRGHGSLDAAQVDEIRAHLYWTMVLIAALTLGSRSVEIFVLNYLGDSTEVGYLTLAGGLTKGSVDLLTVGLTTVLMPMMGRAFGALGAAGVQVIFRDSLRYFIFLGLILAGIGAFWSAPIVALLYGPKFHPVAEVLAIFQIVGGLTISEAAFGSLLATTGRQSTWAKVSCLSIPCSVAGSVLLIPAYGLAGAMLSAVIARIATFSALVFITLRGQPGIVPWSHVIRLWVAACGAFVLSSPVYAADASIRAVLAGALFLTLFVSGSFLLGAWTRRDTALLRAVAQRLPNRAIWERAVAFLERFCSKD